MDNTLELVTLPIGTHSFSIVRFQYEQCSGAFEIYGRIGNSVTNSKIGAEKTKKWKRDVAVHIKNNRGEITWSDKWEYVITIGFFFCRKPYAFDIENYMKPVIDAIAAGLYCNDDENFTMDRPFNFNDSNFRHLFVSRLPDVNSQNEEGVVIHLSAVKRIDALFLSSFVRVSNKSDFLTGPNSLLCVLHNSVGTITY